MSASFIIKSVILLISKYDLSNLIEKKRVLFVCLLFNYFDFFSCHLCYMRTVVLIDSTND